MAREIANIRVGKPDVDPSAPSHTPGVRQGNEEGGYLKQGGHRRDGTSTAERSTGIRPEDRNPIDRRMPNLSPP